MPAQISDKRTMYDLQMRRRLGNCLQVWTTSAEVRRSGYEGPVAIRGLRPGMKMDVNIPLPDLDSAAERYMATRGCVRDDLVFSEMAAPSMGIRRCFNAEVARLDDGLHVAWSDMNAHLPEAMRSARIARLSVGVVVLDHFLDPHDSDDLRELLAEYPDSVVELSVVDRDVGWAKRRLIIWEVRNY